MRDMTEEKAYGEIIPPSTVEIEFPRPKADFADIETIKKYVSKTSNYLKKLIDSLVENVSPTNLRSTVAKLFAENIVRGRVFFADSCIRCQSKNPDSTHLYVALVALVFKYFPMVYVVLERKLLFRSRHMLTVEGSSINADATIKFLSFLINVRICRVEYAPPLLLCCLDKGTDQSVEIAVNFIKQLRISTMAQVESLGVVEKLQRILEMKKLKKQTLDDVERVLDEESWNRIFTNEGTGLLGLELEWVNVELLSSDPGVSNVLERPATVHDLFSDDHDHEVDVLFLVREEAYYMFRRIVLREYYWYPNTSMDDVKYISSFEKIARYPREDRAPICDELISKIECDEEKVKICLDVLKFSVIRGLCVFPVPLFVCMLEKDKNKKYTEILKTCFHVLWLMAAGSRLVTNVATTFAKLLDLGLLSWDFVAHLPFERRDMTHRQRCFLDSFFSVLSLIIKDKPDDLRLISKTILRENPLCVPAAISYFKELGWDEMVCDLKKLYNAEKSTDEEADLEVTKRRRSC